MDIERIVAALQPLGLHALGVCSAEPADRLPTFAGGRLAESIVLVGNVGSSLWPAFEASGEYCDGCPDPLDRWSRRVGGAIATRLGGRVVYPFEGPPYWPFQAWARRCGEATVSPLAVLIHPRFGLWQAYRFALVFDQSCQPGRVGLVAESPCMGCSAQPCLAACPVGAFADHAYKLDACMAHLQMADATCPSQGCLARRACPIGTQFTYTPEHLRFHMKAFMAAQPAR